ncbi:S-adenosyl-L-methionine-dependent methyltransferase [Xylariaceae sp. FL0594]|nr:S-adenosyl-L-methionine-dependent methyltransferase [Xylariaceae sp. FL0594]
MGTSILARAYEAFLGLLNPWVFMSMAGSFLPQTVRKLFETHGFLGSIPILLSPSRFKDAWFGEFWAVAGPNVRNRGGPNVLALLDGRTTGGRVVDQPTGPGIGGVCIEIGAASGLWVEIFSNRHMYEDDTAVEEEKAAEAGGVGGWKGPGPGPGQTSSPPSSSSELRERATATQAGDKLRAEKRKNKRSNTARTQITHVYGVEPNPAHHAALWRSVEAAGLQDIYEIVPVGIEDLSSSSSSSSDNKKWEGNIEPNSVDCIVSVLCLCSIPEPERHTRELYKLLRPGGRWYVYEHVKRESGWVMRIYQRIVNLVWPHFLNGCQICRPTEKTLRSAGPWTKVDVAHLPDEPWYGTLPHILGVFTK